MNVLRVNTLLYVIRVTMSAIVYLLKDLWPKLDAMK